MLKVGNLHYNCQDLYYVQKKGGNLSEVTRDAEKTCPDTSILKFTNYFGSGTVMLYALYLGYKF